jgi:hypothetical protein
VEIELSEEQKAMGYCHCTSCRSCPGDPVHAWTIWAAESFGMIDVLPEIVPGLNFAPTMHVNYAESIHPMDDAFQSSKTFQVNSAELANSCRRNPAP